jgi:hypothetical protein
MRNKTSLITSLGEGVYTVYNMNAMYPHIIWRYHAWLPLNYKNCRSV